MTATYTLNVYDNNTKAPIGGMWVQAMDGSNNAIYSGTSLVGAVTDKNGQAVIVTDGPVAFLQAFGPGYNPGTIQVSANSTNSITLMPGAWKLDNGGGSSAAQPINAAQPGAQANSTAPADNQNGIMVVDFPFRQFIMAHWLISGFVLILLLFLIFKPSEE